MAQRLIVGVTGASGAVLSETILQQLRAAGVETHLVVTQAGKLTWELETKRPVSDLCDLADHVYEEKDFSVAIASGSFMTQGMIIIPCSMKTLAGIVSGYTENLLLRAADVCLKEGRKVVLVPREMPLGKVHLRNLYDAADLGCCIVPPMLTFYNQPAGIQDQINHIAGKVLLQFGIVPEGFRAWEGAQG